MDPLDNIRFLSISIMLDGMVTELLNHPADKDLWARFFPHTREANKQAGDSGRQSKERTEGNVLLIDALEVFIGDILAAKPLLVVDQAKHDNTENDEGDCANCPTKDTCPPEVQRGVQALLSHKNPEPPERDTEEGLDAQFKRTWDDLLSGPTINPGV